MDNLAFSGSDKHFETMTGFNPKGYTQSGSYAKAIIIISYMYESHDTAKQFVFRDLCSFPDGIDQLTALLWLVQFINLLLYLVE